MLTVQQAQAIAGDWYSNETDQLCWFAATGEIADRIALLAEIQHWLNDSAGELTPDLEELRYYVQEVSN